MVKAPTLYLLAIMLTLTPYANQYNTNPIVFLDLKDALKT